MIYKIKILIVQCAKTIFKEENIDYIFYQRAKFFYKKKGVIYIHIPKSAGTSICEMIYGRRLSHYTIKELRDKDSHSQDLANLQTFSVIRNPTDRLLSAYNFALSGGGTNGSVAYASRYRNPMFQDFDRFIFEWLPLEELTSRDRIFWPQVNFLKINKAIAVDRVLKFESSEILSEYLCSLGVSANLAHRNKTKQNKIKKNDLTRSHMMEIEKTYREDFELYRSI